MKEDLGLHPPSCIKQILEKMGVEVAPGDICPRDKLDDFYSLYPDLMGDSTAIGPGDDGKCQSWKDCPKWWKEFVEE